MKRAEAIANGFDYEGYYCGIPIFYRDADYSVAGKCLLFDWLIVAASYMEVLAMMFSGANAFAMKIRPINRRPR